MHESNFIETINFIASISVCMVCQFQFFLRPWWNEAQIYSSVRWEIIYLHLILFSFFMRSLKLDISCSRTKKTIWEYVYHRSSGRTAFNIFSFFMINMGYWTLGKIIQNHPLKNIKSTYETPLKNPEKLDIKSIKYLNSDRFQS